MEIVDAMNRLNISGELTRIRRKIEDDPSGNELKLIRLELEKAFKKPTPLNQIVESRYPSGIPRDKMKGAYNCYHCGGKD